MLKNLNIGAKILVLAGVPMLVLALLGAGSAWDERARSGDTSTESQRLSLIEQLLDTAGQVEIEGLRSLSAVTGDPTAATDLLEQRPLVDASTAGLTAQASALDQLVVGDLSGLFGQLGELGDLRNSIDDGSADAQLVIEYHEDLADRFQVVQQELLADAVGDEPTGLMDLRTVVGLTLGGLVLTALLALVVSRSLTTPLGRLSHAADELAQRTLPAIAAGLRSPDEARTAVKPTVIDVDQKDEIGQLASSLRSAQETASKLGQEQATTLQRGISDLFVSLARRNQSLLDRQLTFIDELEAKEQDPDALADLFRLDHLATRMRRNAENLLVLAGQDAPRRRGEPIEMNDVLRVAIGEVEDYDRIRIVALDPIAVDGNAAVDIAHLTAELVENATSFSPPDSIVELVGSHMPGGYAIAVTDHGVGMSVEALRDANRLIASPPAVGFELSRSLGFIVVGHLAKRLGVSVELGDGPNGGTTAVISIPSTVLNAAELNPAPVEANPSAADGQNPPSSEAHAPHAAAEPDVPSEAVDAAPSVEDTPLPTVEAPPAPAPTEAPVSAAPDAPPVLPQLQPSAPPPALLEDALPTEPDFDAGLAELAPPVPPGPELSIPEPPSPNAAPTLTAAGLPKRVPPTPGESGPAPLAINGPVSAPSKRSPEEVRTMLARYRNGLHHGRGEATPREIQS